MSGRKEKRIICAAFACALILVGCQGTQGESGTDASAADEVQEAADDPVLAAEGIQETAETSDLAADEVQETSALAAEETSEASAETSDSPQASVLSASEMFTDRDYRTEYEEESAAEIALEGETAVCSSDAVQIDGSTVTITDEGIYVLSGTLDDGSIVVAADKKDKVQLVLNQASVVSADSAALYVSQADKVFVTLAEGTENTLGNGGKFADSEESNIDAAVFSREDLTLNGTGSLTVESPAGHGIVSKDDLVFTGGSYIISCAGQGLSGKDSVRIADGVFTITAGTDGIHSENTEDDTKGFVYLQSGTFSIAAEGDGVSASGTLQIEDGNFTITAGGGSVNGSKDRSSSWGGFGGSWGEDSDQTEDGASMKGIKAGGNLTVNGGSFAIDAADDGVHSNASATVSGGEFTIASGDDGIHADDTLTVSAGKITVTESYEGLEGLHMVIPGGEIDATATDDGFNAAGGTDSSGFGGRDGRFGGGWATSSSDGTLMISGGSIRLQASGDAIDANGSMEMTGGTVITSGPNSGDTSILDYDLTAVISGGTFIGTGSSMMAENFSGASTQGAILAVVSAQSAGTIVTLSDSEGNILAEQEAEQDFSCVLISCKEILKGETYTLTVGAEAQSVTMDSLIVSMGSGRGGW